MLHLSCSSSCFPFDEEAGHSSLCCMDTFVIFSIPPCCWPILLSLPFPEISLHSFYFSYSPPRFLQPHCFFVSDLFGNISSFILTMCPTRFIRILLFCQLYKLWFQLLLLGLSFSFSPLSLHRLFSLSSCSHIGLPTTY